MSTMTVSGPMFEPAKTRHWESVYKKEGAHYNNYGCRDEHGMDALRALFPSDAHVNEMNLVIFSTSGIHGLYTTIEEAEQEWLRGGKDEDGEDTTPLVTFLVIQPRICCLRHGNCLPQSAEDFAYLRRLRELSWAAVLKIGRHDEA
jgi:hypothetical protein